METGEKERPLPSTKQESRSPHQHCGNRTGHAIPYIRRKCTFYEKAAAGKHVEFLTARRFCTIKMLDVKVLAYVFRWNQNLLADTRHLSLMGPPKPLQKQEKQCYKYLPHPMKSSLGIPLRPSFLILIPCNAGGSLFCTYRLFSLCLYRIIIPH